MTAQEIINFLNRYAGFDAWWYNIDPDDQQTILDDLNAELGEGE